MVRRKGGVDYLNLLTMFSFMRCFERYLYMYFPAKLAQLLGRRSLLAGRRELCDPHDRHTPWVPIVTSLRAESVA
jgi:hypothetical protein